MQYLSYRNLGEPGGPEFSEEEVKAIAAGFEVTDGPDAQGEMFTRPGRPSDKFVSPYPNVNAALQQMEELILLICLYLLKLEKGEPIIFIQFWLVMRIHLRV